MARGLQLFEASETRDQTSQHLTDEAHQRQTQHESRFCIVLMEHHTSRSYETWQKAKMFIFTFALIFGSMSLAAALGYWFFSLDAPTGHIHLGKLYLHVTFNTSRFFELRDGRKYSDSLFLKGNLGFSIPKVAQFKVLTKNSSLVHIMWDPYAELKVLYSDSESEKTGVTCYDFTWKGNGGVLGNKLEDCIELGSAKWYGTFMNDNDIESRAESRWYWTRQEEVWLDFDSSSFTKGEVPLERYWLLSNGVGIHVSSDVPLKARLAADKTARSLCFKAALKNYSTYDPYTPLYLSYSVCKSSDIRTIHECMVKKYHLHPSKRVADKEMFQDTLWVLPDHDGNNKGYTPLATQQFAQRILDKGYRNSAIEIDFEKLIGNGPWPQGASNKKKDSLSVFIPARVSEILKRLTTMGFCVVVRIPFVKLLHYSISSEVSYRSDRCNLECVNLYDETALKIFGNNMLSALSNVKQQHHICSFLFDFATSSSEHGILTSLVQRMAYNLLNALPACCPNSISNMAFGVQKASLFIQMTSVSPNWSRATGLKSVIPKALTLSILGYPYIIPPKCLEIERFSLNSTGIGLKLQDPELYIRWFQLTSLFPVATLTMDSWILDDSNLSTALLETLEVRKRLLPTILQLVKQSEAGRPILRPLWWLEPDNRNVYEVEDEFLVGDNILVAPVLSPGIQSRDIYFPTGYWQDQRLSLTLRGGQWYRNYEVSANNLPYFLRTKEPWTDESGKGSVRQVRLPDENNWAKMTKITEQNATKCTVCVRKCLLKLGVGILSQCTRRPSRFFVNWIAVL